MSGTVPEIDRTIGIGVYATPFPGLGRGYGIRATPDDFVVSEILSPAALRMIRDPGAGGNGNADADASAKGMGYAVYVLRKRGIDTAHALGAIRKMTGAKLKPLGLKDASATTTQYVCSTGAAGRRLRDIRASRFGLAFAGYAKRPLTKRQMLGNGFRIRISGDWGGPGGGDSNRGDATAATTAPDPSGFAAYADSVPNFYGYQRFGSGRPVTHMVGRALTMGDHDEAVRLILEYASPYDTRERREVRENLADPALYAQSARRLPPGMDTEKTVLEELARHGDPLRAIRAVPLLLRRLYVSAYQSYVFNRTLSAVIAAGESLLDPKPGDVCFDRNGDLHKYDGTASAAAATAGSGGENVREADAHGGLIRVRNDAVAIPIVGYSYYSKTRFAPYVSDVLVDEGVKPRAFFLNEMQEASGEGGFRDAVLQCSGYAWHDGTKTVEFSLARGSFATMLLRELIKPPNPISTGF
ncbi:MAG: tRNA pseudouridine(13) synthase TruD [Thaumarchaeota archaeon]|nr:tRNA pseudouridine(13) synthase TruD [Nitrososphaerota archaeon]